LQTISERYQLLGKPTTLFIRISQNSVAENGFHEWLEKHIKDIGPGGGILVVEVTEQCAERFFKETKQLREHLQRLGCGFALAHFGGRPNSERILNHLLPDYLKLEGSLIEKFAKGRDAEGRRAMAALTQQAQGKNILVVAADIATAPQMASIWQFGVTLVQGDMVQEPGEQMDFDFKQFAG
jgi:EAL domain-containing protein (putative c-di-GMP-specific phosphodiesterase class I)